MGRKESNQIKQITGSQSYPESSIKSALKKSFLF